jgi:hypothetical protein
MMSYNNIKYSVEQSKDGKATLSAINNEGKKIYLHSRYNPLKEAENLKDKFIPDKFNMVIILGSGLGYHLLALKEIIDKYYKIIIVDIIKDIEKEIAKNPDTGFLAKSSRIKFLTGAHTNEIEDFLNMEIDFNEIKGIDVIEHSSSVTAFNSYYNEIKNTIRVIINKKAGNAATQKAFGSLYLKNIFKNFNIFSSLYSVSVFFKTMLDYPALVIASGPGMEDHLKEIKASQNKFFIIAADSAINTLIRNEIFADFFMSVDPQPFTAEHLLGVNIKSAVPIFTLSSCPVIVDRFKGSRGLLSLNTHPIAQIADEMSPGALGSVDSLTGTVSGDAVMAAHEFGFRKTGLIGFDFSFPDFKIYPRESAYQKRFLNSSSRFNPIETINFNYVMKSSKGLKYEDKFTRKSFIQYKESMERFLKEINSNKIFNINDKGIPIHGIKNIDFNFFIKNYCSRKINKESIINIILDKASKSGSLIIYKKLKNLIRKENIFNEVLNASMNAKAFEKKSERLRTLLKNIEVK